MEANDVARKKADPLYRLSHDDEQIMVASEGECWRYLHQIHCYSVDHACKYEGYRLELLVE